MSAVSRLKDLTRPTGEEDLLDVTYPTPRWAIPPRHAALFAGVVVLLVVAWLLLRSGPGDGPAPDTLAPGIPGVGDRAAAVELNALPEAPGATGTAADGELVVSVIGEVTSPGLVTLAPGARVADALAVAEPLPGAELVSLNQAQRLADGQQLVVPGAVGDSGSGDNGGDGGGGGAGEAAVAADGRVSLNSATVTELTTLDGVGEKTAEAIITHRESTGGFTAPEQLLEVKGIGPAKYEALKEQVAL